MAITNGKRKSIMDRDEGRCRYCGDRAENLDHVIPRSAGGGDHLGNFVASCVPCNTFKADRTPEEAGMVVLPRGTVLSENAAKRVRLAFPGWNPSKTYRMSEHNREGRERKRLRREAAQAATDPYNLHYPYNPARPSSRVVRRD